MNPTVFLPPAAALLLVAVWIGPQRGVIGELERQNDVLSAHIQAARLSRDSGSDPSLAARMHQKQELDDGRIDWEKLAAAQGANPDMRATVDLQKKLLAMSAEELVMELDAIASLDLAESVKRRLEGTLFGVLAGKDPQLALDCFADRIGDDRGGMAWQLTHAFGQWVSKDAAAAAAWMDRQLDAGVFDSKALDGKNRHRLQFEAALVKDLVTSDPDAAARRLANLPEDQRAEVFSHGIFARMQPGSGKAVADLIRSEVPEDARAATLAQVAAPLTGEGNFGKVGGFLSEIDANREERATIVSRTLAHSVEAGVETDVDETRAWILEQAPDDAGSLTGEALGRMIESQDFAAMADKALEFRQADGSDEVLVSFLKHAPNSERFAILDLAAEISDPEQRDEITRRFMNNPNRELRPAESHR